MKLGTGSLHAGILMSETGTWLRTCSTAVSPLLRLSSFSCQLPSAVCDDHEPMTLDFDLALTYAASHQHRITFASVSSKFSHD